MIIALIESKEVHYEGERKIKIEKAFIKFLKTVNTIFFYHTEHCKILIYRIKESFNAYFLFVISLLNLIFLDYLKNQMRIERKDFLIWFRQKKL